MPKITPSPKKSQPRIFRGARLRWRRRIPEELVELKAILDELVAYIRTLPGHEDYSLGMAGHTYQVELVPEPEPCRAREALALDTSPRSLGEAYEARGPPRTQNAAGATRRRSLEDLIEEFCNPIKSDIPKKRHPENSIFRPRVIFIRIRPPEPRARAPPASPSPECEPRPPAWPGGTATLVDEGPMTDDKIAAPELRDFLLGSTEPLINFLPWQAGALIAAARAVDPADPAMPDFGDGSATFTGTTLFIAMNADERAEHRDAKAARRRRGARP